jgi:hypothetical protein
VIPIIRKGVSAPIKKDRKKKKREREEHISERLYSQCLKMNSVEYDEVQASHEDSLLWEGMLIHFVGA